MVSITAGGFSFISDTDRFRLEPAAESVSRVALAEETACKVRYRCRRRREFLCMVRCCSCVSLLLLPHPMLVTDLLEAGFFALESRLLRAAHLAKSLWSLLADALGWPTSRISSAFFALLTTAWLAGLDVHPLLGEPSVKSSFGFIT